MVVTLEPHELNLHTSFHSASQTDRVGSATFHLIDQTLAVNGCDDDGAGFFVATVHMKQLLERLAMKLHIPDVKRTVSSIKACRQLSGSNLSTATCDSTKETEAVLDQDTKTARSVKDVVVAEIANALAHGTKRYAHVGESNELVCTSVSRRRDNPSVLKAVSFDAEEQANQKTVSFTEDEVVQGLLKLGTARDGEDVGEVLRSAASTREEYVSVCEQWKLEAKQGGDGSFLIDILVETNAEASDGFAFAPALRLVL